MFYTAWHFETFGSSDTNHTISSSLYMQRHLWRTAIHHSQPKSIHNTQRVIYVNWHTLVTYPKFSDGKDNWDPVGFVPVNDGPQNVSTQCVGGYVHHFRSICKNKPSKCKTMTESNPLVKIPIMDESLPRYLNTKKQKMRTVLNEIYNHDSDIS